jgi:hypothetical protein
LQLVEVRTERARVDGDCCGGKEGTNRRALVHWCVGAYQGAACGPPQTRSGAATLPRVHVKMGVTSNSTRQTWVE